MKPFHLSATLALPLLVSHGAAQEQATPERRLVEDDARRAYYLLLPEDTGPRRSLHLVLTMPGGSGQAADFLPWLTRVRDGLGDDFALAALSAPEWSADQTERVVWITDYWRGKFPEAKFSTEEFLRDVLDDVKRRKEFRVESVLLFGWSSSGPAVYAASSESKVPYDGYLVLSSVFKADQLHGLSKVKKRRYYLLQGEEDTVTRLSFAEEAQGTLTRKKAVVHLEAFPGGHGFAMPDPFGSLKRGFEWLLSNEKE